MTIETPRTILRRPDRSDAEAIFSYRSDAEANRYQGWIPESLDDVEAFIERIPDEFNTPETWYQMVVVTKEDRRVIGDLGVHFVDRENRLCEIGCTLAPEQQGQGYASEAMRAVIGHLFEELGKHRISASVDPRNESSIALLERLGFRREAHLRESLYFRGEWVDDIIYGLLAREWDPPTRR